MSIKIVCLLNVVVITAADLVQTVSDQREDEEAAEGRQEPHPPGDARLPGLAGDDSRGDAVSLNVIRVLVRKFIKFSKCHTWKARCLSSTKNGSFVTRVTSLEEIFTFSA